LWRGFRLFAIKLSTIFQKEFKNRTTILTFFFNISSTIFQKSPKIFYRYELNARAAAAALAAPPPCGAAR
jgi:hypothetical protein